MSEQLRLMLHPSLHNILDFKQAGQPEQQQEPGHAVLRQTLRVDLLLPAWLVARYTAAHLDIIMREGFSDLASFKSGGASPESICHTLMQAGLPLVHACVLEGALVREAEREQWYRQQQQQQQQQQQGPKEGGVAAGHGSRNGGVGPAAELRLAARTPSQDDTDAGHAHDQQPTCGGGTSASTASKGWWGAWLPSAPALLWSTQQPPQPQPPLHALPPGSATSPPGSAAAAAAAVAATCHAAASTTAPTPERRAVVLDDAAHSSVAPIAAPPTLASTCRRRHVHRPALGQE